jgi:hypothetical protein
LAELCPLALELVDLKDDVAAGSALHQGLQSFHLLTNRRTKFHQVRSLLRFYVWWPPSVFYHAGLVSYYNNQCAHILHNGGDAPTILPFPDTLYSHPH